MPYNQWIKVLIGVAICVYLISMLFALLGKRRLGWGAMVSGWGGTAVITGFNWWIAGEPPLGNMFHVMVFLALCMLPALLVLAWRNALGWLLPWFACASLIALVGAFFMNEDTVWRRVPALQSGWFVPHVVTYIFAYALCTVAIMLRWVYGLRRLTGREGDNQNSFLLAEICILRLSFPFLTFGLLSGALWAEEAWGKYWSWDVKESWALVTWLFYLIYFHCRRHRNLTYLTVWAHSAAYGALIFTFLVVNLGLIDKLRSALHSYA